MGGVRCVESSPNLFRILSLDHLGNGSTEDVQERFDVEVVGSLGNVKQIKVAFRTSFFHVGKFSREYNFIYIIAFA